MITVTAVIKIVAEYYGLRAAQLTSGRRMGFQARARHVAFYLARTMTGNSYPAIARHFSCDHTTVLSGVRRIESLRGEDAKLVADLIVLTDKVAASALPEPQPVTTTCPHCHRFYIEPDKRIEMLAEVRGEVEKLNGRIELLERV